MRRFTTMAVAVAAAAFCSMSVTGTSTAAPGTRAPASSHVAAPGGGWGTAQKVPGLEALNAGTWAEIFSVSCASAGNCSAVGHYYDVSGNILPFVVDEKHGSWGTAQKVQVPGLAALGQVDAEILSVSCGSAGNCSAGGYYGDGNANYRQPFVVDEKDGSWGTAQKVPGIAALNTRRSAAISSVSCGSAGNCSAGGSYLDGSRHNQPFVVDEKHGSWGTAQKVPSIAALDKGGDAVILSVSCGSAGDCSAGGYYTSKALGDDQEAFVVSERHGTWGTARKVPGLAALNTGGNGRPAEAQITSVSCGSAGNCSAGGSYVDGSGHAQPFVVGERHHSWGAAKEVPGIAALNTGGFAEIASVSCASAGNCSAGGDYKDDSDSWQPFVVDERYGTWGTARKVTGIKDVWVAIINSVSCGSAGDCSAGGYYRSKATGVAQALVVSEKHGSWGLAEEVPGIATLNTSGDAEITSVSCASAGNCSAGGQYNSDDFVGDSQGFVVGENLAR